MMTSDTEAGSERTLHKAQWKVWAVVELAALLSITALYYSFFSIDTVGEGVWIYETSSPGGTYTLRFYKLTEMGQYSDVPIRVEVTDNGTGRSRNIYYERQRYFDDGPPYDKRQWVSWEVESVAVVFGMTLDVRTDTYSARWEEALIWLLFFGLD